MFLPALPDMASGDPRRIDEKTIKETARSRGITAEDPAKRRGNSPRPAARSVIDPHRGKNPRRQNRRNELRCIRRGCQALQYRPMIPRMARRRPELSFAGGATGKSGRGAKAMGVV